jgi:hypothetical protein
VVWNQVAYDIDGERRGQQSRNVDIHLDCRSNGPPIDVSILAKT